MTAPLLELTGLVKHFPVRRGLVAALKREPALRVRAVDGVDLTVGRGEVLAVVGESGCGKTTIARLLIGLETPTRGTIRFDGRRVGPEISLKALRRRVQMVFQDPYESLNPRATVAEIVSEPLVVHGLAGRGAAVGDKILAALDGAGLRPAQDYLHRYPHELSGGQRQRVVIAAAMVLDPELIVADEPVSMLDVSIRAEVLNLLRDLREQRHISLVFITHDLSTVAYFADRIAVMYLGRIVEIGPARQVLTAPQHPYTRALLSVMPVVNPRLRRERIILSGETPNPIAVPGGCRFHPRCPVAEPRCAAIDPALTLVAPDQSAACVLASRAPEVQD